MNHKQVLDNLELETLKIEAKIAVCNRYFKFFNLRKANPVAAPVLAKLANLQSKLERIDRLYILVRDRWYFGL